MDALIEKHPYYAVSTVPAALYPKAANDEDIQTVGVMTTLVTSADVDADAVYEVTKAIFENLETFRGMHDAFAGLTPDGMVNSGISIPYHPGAKRYFVEAGLLSE